MGAVAESHVPASGSSPRQSGVSLAGFRCCLGERDGGAGGEAIRRLGGRAGWSGGYGTEMGDAARHCARTEDRPVARFYSGGEGLADIGVRAVRLAWRGGDRFRHRPQPCCRVASGRAEAAVRDRLALGDLRNAFSRRRRLSRRAQRRRRRDRRQGRSGRLVPGRLDGAGLRGALPGQGAQVGARRRADRYSGGLVRPVAAC